MKNRSDERGGANVLRQAKEILKDCGSEDKGGKHTVEIRFKYKKGDRVYSPIRVVRGKDFIALEGVDSLEDITSKDELYILKMKVEEQSWHSCRHHEAGHTGYMVSVESTNELLDFIHMDFIQYLEDNHTTTFDSRAVFETFRDALAMIVTATKKGEVVKEDWESFFKERHNQIAPFDLPVIARWLAMFAKLVYDALETVYTVSTEEAFDSVEEASSSLESFAGQIKGVI